jgi:hypothetical protein
MRAELHEGLHVKCSLLLSDVNKTWNLWYVSEILNIKFHENQLSGSPVLSMRVDRHGETSKRILQHLKM